MNEFNSRAVFGNQFIIGCSGSSYYYAFHIIITRVFSRDVVLGGKLLLWGEKM